MKRSMLQTLLAWKPKPKKNEKGDVDAEARAEAEAKEVNWKAKDVAGRSAFHQACAAGHVEVVQVNQQKTKTKAAHHLIRPIRGIVPRRCSSTSYST